MRLLRYLAILAGVVLLGLSVVTGVQSNRSRSADSLDARLDLLAKQQVRTIESTLERSSAVILQLANAPSFLRFAEAAGSTNRKVNRQIRPVVESQAALAYIREIVPRGLGAASFVDVDGREVARVVDGRHVPPDELERDVSASPPLEGIAISLRVRFSTRVPTCRPPARGSSRRRRGWSTVPAIPLVLCSLNSSSTVTLGKDLGLRIVAEGVEDDLSAGLLEKLGCDFAQGRLISDALPSDELIRWLLGHADEEDAVSVAARSGVSGHAQPQAGSSESESESEPEVGTPGEEPVVPTESAAEAVPAFAAASSCSTV